LPSFKIDLTFYKFTNDLATAKKRHPSLLEDLRVLLSSIEKDYRVGDQIPGVGAHVRKIRLGCKKASVGKSKGYRLIYSVQVDIGLITPLCLHYKPDIEMIPAHQIWKLWKEALGRHASTDTLSTM
jgi:hypothetical protein